MARRRTAWFASVDAIVCSNGPHRVDEARARLRQALHGNERRAADGRTVVLEPAPQQLELLTEAELPDRTIGDRALAVVAAACGGLDLFVPLLAQRRQLALGARLRELVGLGGSFGEGHGGVMLIRHGREGEPGERSIRAFRFIGVRAQPLRRC